MIINWKGYKWLTQERWGKVHPDKPYNWYDPNCVRIDDKDRLVLDIIPNPRVFNIDGKIVKSPYGTGLVCCETNFSFGRFEISAKLPMGVGLWPAFWLYPSDGWPPEIDIIEGYSGTKDYETGCFLKPYNIESCIHSAIGAGQPVRRYWFYQLDDPDRSFNTYALVWQPDELIFLINNKVVRRIKNKDILNELSKHKMRVIINNHIDGRYLDKFKIISPFLIEYFEYTKK
jgi:beta-glucanase (GH16 family)